MPTKDKVAFQAAIISKLASRGRRPFRGPVALDLQLQTTEATPAHAHTIAKNLLDLLGQPIVLRQGYRRGVLYFDDNQIQALSVTCSHGATEPSVRITACAFNDFLQDLDLAVYASTQNDEKDDDDYLDNGGISAGLPGNADQLRQILGDEFADFWLKEERSSAQKSLLRAGRISLIDLGYLYNAYGSSTRFRKRDKPDFSREWESVVRRNPFRIHLEELPQEDGTSASYARTAIEKILEFQQRYPKILRSIDIPVALVVIVKPPGSSQTRGKHDLDNVLRDYLIPRVVDAFSPPSSYWWTLDDTPSSRDRGYWSNDSRPTLPASTRVGLSRYEAWRLRRHPEDNRPGFVSVAVVPDMFGLEGVFSRIDRAITKFELRLD